MVILDLRETLIEVRAFPVSETIHLDHFVACHEVSRVSKCNRVVLVHVLVCPTLT